MGHEPDSDEPVHPRHPRSSRGAAATVVRRRVRGRVVRRRPATSPPSSRLGACAASPSPTAAADVASTPSIPSNFVAIIDNPWFPLIPGTTFRYRGTADGEPTTDVVRGHDRDEGGRRRHDARSIKDDIVRVRGVVEERTEDWYAQDRDGNVWYFGEETAELDRHGKVTSTPGRGRPAWTARGPASSCPPTPDDRRRRSPRSSSRARPRTGSSCCSRACRATVPAGTYRTRSSRASGRRSSPAIVGEKWYAKGVGPGPGERTSRAARRRSQLVEGHAAPDRDGGPSPAVT